MVCRWSKKLYGEDRATSQILALSAGATGQMWIKERRTESFVGRTPAGRVKAPQAQAATPDICAPSLPTQAPHRPL